jgi:hypothetical protein
MFYHKVAKRKYLFWIVGALVVLVTGCASMPPTPEELARADYGPQISQEDAEAKAMGFLRQYLKDPESAKVEWGTVQKGWMREARIYGGQLRFGYILSANINAKNSFGGYTGYKAYQFTFFNGSIVSIYAQKEPGDSNGSAVLMSKIY